MLLTWRLLSGSIFMTGPKVLRGRETSMLWFGISGVWMARGVLGMTPKLGRRKSEGVHSSAAFLRALRATQSLALKGKVPGTAVPQI